MRATYGVQSTWTFLIAVQSNFHTLAHYSTARRYRPSSLHHTVRGHSVPADVRGYRSARSLQIIRAWNCYCFSWTKRNRIVFDSAAASTPRRIKTKDCAPNCETGTCLTVIPERVQISGFLMTLKLFSAHIARWLMIAMKSHLPSVWDLDLRWGGTCLRSPRSLVTVVLVRYPRAPDVCVPASKDSSWTGRRCAWPPIQMWCV